MAMERHIFHIELVNGQMSGDSKTENRPYGGRLKDWTKCFFAIVNLSLNFTISNESFLVPDKRTININFFV